MRSPPPPPSLLAPIGPSPAGPEGAHERPGSEEGLDGDEGAQGASAEDGAGSNFVGKRLTLADLEPHFHLGLREAAAALGVAPTTLKRVCRRLGIPKWPRRELQRLTRQGAGDVSAVDVALGKHEQTGEDPEVGANGGARLAHRNADGRARNVAGLCTHPGRVAILEAPLLPSPPRSHTLRLAILLTAAAPRTSG